MVAAIFIKDYPLITCSILGLPNMVTVAIYIVNYQGKTFEVIFPQQLKIRSIDTSFTD